MVRLKNYRNDSDFLSFSGHVYFYDQEGVYTGKVDMLQGSSIDSKVENRCPDDGDSNVSDGGGGPSNGGDGTGSTGDNGHGDNGNNGNGNSNDGGHSENCGWNIEVNHCTDHEPGGECAGDVITMGTSCEDKSMSNALRNPCPPEEENSNCGNINDCEFGYDDECGCLEEGEGENGSVGITSNLTVLNALFDDFFSNLSNSEQDWLENNPDQKWVIRTFLNANTEQLFSTSPLTYNDQAVDLISLAIDNLISYTETNYPGLDLGYPFEWWKDNDFIVNTEVLHIDEQLPNAKELALFNLFPGPAISHIENSIVALDKAFELANNGTFIPSSIEDGKADAFRHAYWNALGTADFGSFLMKLFADAHEWNESGIAVDMDLHNNFHGRELGSNFDIFNGDEEIANATLQILINGVLKYINSSGSLVFTNQ